METQPLFRNNGDQIEMGPAGVLLLAAKVIYGDPDETTPAGKRNAKIIVDGILAAARAGGYKQCDILETLLASNRATQRVIVMSQAACSAAGRDAICDVLARVGVRPA